MALEWKKKKTWKPWRQSDFIINNSAFIGRVVRYGVTFRNSISNWQTGEIFLISRTISLWCIHYEATVASLITQNNVRAIPETTPLAIHGGFSTFSGIVSLPLSDNMSGGLSNASCFLLPCYYRPNPQPMHEHLAPFPSVLWFHIQPSCLPLWPFSRGESISCQPETCLRSKEWGGRAARRWLTCWYAADTLL